MFRIINFIKLLRISAFVTTVVSILSYQFLHRFWDNDLPLIKVISITPWVSFLIVILLTTATTSRFFWSVLRYFNKELYPDLNGSWIGEITTERNMIIGAQATIKQTLLKTEIIMHTETSKSVTLETTPSVDSGQCKLYYVYRSIPKDPARQAYTGSTVFDIRSKKVDSSYILELSGSYFTDRKTIGRVRLEQESKDIHKDVSFY
ncbi:hypothetical protein [Pectobacterium brasiliense]|uniref:Cap15 family cyclic dinucleotide receptor domain-containing protein n=1 Tax=Pectobacterium brasiliense TaxID=180957 RepID=UPI001969580E|nr:hypothetical protein [Pectobacterium brasiliense]MBN3145617.1 hypothetical protein [Pectobacterium brasiliense]